MNYLVASYYIQFPGIIISFLRPSMASINTKDVDFIDEFSFESSSKEVIINPGETVTPVPLPWARNPVPTVPIPLPFMSVSVYRSTGILPVIKPAELDDSTENTIVISKKPRPSTARRPLPITEFPPEIPLDCRTSKVKLRSYFRKHEGKYPEEHINAMYILARRASNVKASQRNRAKAKALAQCNIVNVASAQPN